MAYITKRGSSWLAQIRRAGVPSVSKSFPTKSLANEWVRLVEREMDENKYQDIRPITSVTLATLITRYNEEIGGKQGFGKNKTAVLRYINTTLGHLKLPELNAIRLTAFVSDRLKGGVTGVTVNIDLTYIQGVLKVASELWGIKGDMDAVRTARNSMGYKGVSTKSVERKRRPTQSEIDRLCDLFRNRSRRIIPMEDIIPFAIETAMRAGEIMRITWGDVNVADKTVIIRDRKHPKNKIGNDQEVPLLGASWDIIMRQASKPQVLSGSKDRIFPYSEQTISSIFPRAVQALNIEDLRFHDLRHEGVSRLFEQGYAIEQVSLVSGHKDWAMLRRYVQLSAKDLHRIKPNAPAPNSNTPTLTSNNTTPTKTGTALPTILWEGNNINID